jgi:hypothetical protein
MQVEPAGSLRVARFEWFPYYHRERRCPDGDDSHRQAASSKHGKLDMDILL